MVIRFARANSTAGSYPRTRRALSIDKSVSFGANSFLIGTPGKHSAISSALGRLITVSALAIIKASNPLSDASNALRTA